MNDIDKSQVEFNSAVYRENSDKFTFEQLKPYFGKQVAWSRDGMEILASGNSYEEVHEELDKAGIPTDLVVFSFVPDPDIVYI